MAMDCKQHGLGPEPKVGFDIGRVIIHAGDGAQDTSFLSGNDDDAMRTPPMKGAFEVIAEVNALVGGRTWIISKCGPNIARRSLRWLRHHRFYEHTGMREDRVIFCRKRPEKAPHCLRLGLDVFVDDRPDIHQTLAGIVGVRVLFGPQKRGRQTPPGVLAALDWDEVRQLLIPLLCPGHEGASSLG